MTIDENSQQDNSKILLRSKKLNSLTSALKTFLWKLATKAIRTSKRISNLNRERIRKNAGPRGPSYI